MGVFLGVLLGLAGGWRLYTDLQPVPELATCERYLRQGKVDQAERALRAILHRSSRHGGARELLAQLLARKGDKLGCAHELNQIPAWWPGKRGSSFIEGQTFLELNLAQNAEHAFLLCVKNDPLHQSDPARVSSAAKGLLTLYLLEDRVSEAQDVLWEAFDQASPEERGAILNMQMRAATEQIEPSEAVETLRGYVKGDPTDWHARLGLAKAEEQLGNRGEADKLLSQCLKERPESIECWQTRLALLAARNQPDVLHDAIEQMPVSVTQSKNSLIRELQGIDRLNAGEFEKAKELLESALELDPFNPDTMFRLAGIEQRLNQTDSAERHRNLSQTIRKARQDIPESLLNFRNQEQSRGTDPTQHSQAIEKLAVLCETLGWEKLALEWRKASKNYSRN